MISQDSELLTQSNARFKSAPGPKRIRVHQWNQQNVTLLLLVVTMIGVTVVTLVTMERPQLDYGKAIQDFVTNIKSMLFQPKLNGGASFTDLLNALGKTVAISMLTTMMGAFVAFFLALLAARNLSVGWLATGLRLLMALIRAIPGILWVLIFSIVLGLGANAAVIGLSFHSLAYLTKAYSESIEEVGTDTLTALKVTGANWWQIIFQAILPAVTPAFLSWTFIRFEINFADTVAVGAAAGAGGIGYELFMASGMAFDFNEVGVIVYLCLAFTILLEYISLKLRKQYLVKQF